VVPSNLYKCPLYRTVHRAGVMNTTGQSKNFVLHMQLPVQAATRPADWTLQGVAALCEVT
jgi:dynein heavy chain, axonemal